MITNERERVREREREREREEKKEIHLLFETTKVVGLPTTVAVAAPPIFCLGALQLSFRMMVVAVALTCWSAACWACPHTWAPASATACGCRRANLELWPRRWQSLPPGKCKAWCCKTMSESLQGKLWLQTPRAGTASSAPKASALANPWIESLWFTKAHSLDICSSSFRNLGWGGPSSTPEGRKHSLLGNEQTRGLQRIQQTRTRCLRWVTFRV